MATTSKKKSAKTVSERPPKFTIERLRKDCLEIFGITFSTFDGATFDLMGEYTIEEIKAHIEKWKNGQAVPSIKKEGE